MQVFLVIAYGVSRDDCWINGKGSFAFDFGCVGAGLLRWGARSGPWAWSGSHLLLLCWSSFPPHASAAFPLFCFPSPWTWTCQFSIFHLLGIRQYLSFCAWLKSCCIIFLRFIPSVAVGQRVILFGGWIVSHSVCIHVLLICCWTLGLLPSFGYCAWVNDASMKWLYEHLQSPCSRFFWVNMQQLSLSFTVILSNFSGRTELFPQQPQVLHSNQKDTRVPITLAFCKIIAILIGMKGCLIVALF